MEPIPYHEGEPPPGPDYMLCQLRREDGSEGGLHWVNPADLEPGPIIHKEVDCLGPMLRWTWRHLGKHAKWCRTFEDWELGFMRDTKAGGELALWAKLTYAYVELTHRHPAADKAIVFNPNYSRPRESLGLLEHLSC